jgi:hypothetical protein
MRKVNGGRRRVLVDHLSEFDQDHRRAAIEQILSPFHLRLAGEEAGS